MDKYKPNRQLERRQTLSHHRASQRVRMQPFSDSSELLGISCTRKIFMMMRQTKQFRSNLVDKETDKPTSRQTDKQTLSAGNNIRLQRLLNAAARVVSNTGKFDRGLTHLLHSELHWLDVPQRILHKLGVTVHRCLQGKAPQYLVNCCHPTSDIASRQRLRSSSRHHLVVPRHRRSTLGRRAFSVTGPMA